MIEIIRASEMGFCFGVRRAIDVMEQVAQGHERIDSLGSIVHNPQVVERLASQGIHVAKSLEEVSGGTVAITAHGVGPEVVEGIRARGLGVIDTTCPIVERSQTAAKKLVEEGFTAVVYGDGSHPEVRGVLAWTDGKGIATTDPDFLKSYKRPPKRIGLLAQTTQVPEHFAAFVNRIIQENVEGVAEWSIPCAALPQSSSTPLWIWPTRLI
ncbi:MAG: hypothetical protein HW403_1077 [Dehalococcoidia bacterium]|nr:hypothetical protein [Dehalococcoidia bacterium]